MTGDGAVERERALDILRRLESKAVTIQTRTGAKLADDSAPGGKKKGKPARISAKGPSKKAKKRT